MNISDVFLTRITPKATTFSVAVENRAEQVEASAGSNLVCVNVHFMAMDFSKVAFGKLVTNLD